ncbi:MAG: hypothetical protein JNL72_07895 [Flavipsychrobacter sp.]|nr:hypothetical protein [Flavipsychrobacter sp.]
MKLRLFFSTLLFSILAVAASAQKAKPGTAYAQITSATMRTEPRPGSDPEVFYNFNTTWKSSAKPEAIFFRGQEAWANCVVIKDGKDISPELIKKGNKVSFKTISGGRFAIPKELDGIKAPALFFQVKGKWYYLPVRNIKKMNTR